MRITLFAGMAALVATFAAAQTTPQTYRGLRVIVTGVEHVDKASLNDCPPGSNAVNAVARPGDHLAVVAVAFKVLPSFEKTTLKRPVITSTDGKTYNTSVQFVDVGSTPEFSCQFTFRVPEGTRLKSFAIDTLSIDLTPMESK